MNLTNLNGTTTQIETSNFVVLFSYKTPVAYQDKSTGKFFKTDKKWSVTTSKHISIWLEGAKAEIVAQKILDALI